MEKSDGYTQGPLRRRAVSKTDRQTRDTLLIPGPGSSARRETSMDNNGDLNAQWKTVRLRVTRENKSDERHF